MFKNRALHIQLTKPLKQDTPDSTPARPTIDPDAIHNMVKNQVKHTAVAVIAVFAAVTVLKTGSEIAINAAPKKH